MRPQRVLQPPAPVRRAASIDTGGCPDSSTVMPSAPSHPGQRDSQPTLRPHAGMGSLGMRALGKQRGCSATQGWAGRLGGPGRRAGGATPGHFTHSEQCRSQPTMAAWTRVLLDGGPRSRPARRERSGSPSTASGLHCSHVDALRPPTRSDPRDVLTHLNTLHGHHRRDQLVALRSLFF